MIAENRQPIPSEQFMHRYRLMETFKFAINYLGHDFEDKDINKLFKKFGKIVKTQASLIPIRITSDVSTVWFNQFRDNGSKAEILIPDNWLVRIQDDQYSEVSSLVFAASQAVDYQTMRSTPDQNFKNTSPRMVTRAGQMQAKYLEVIQDTVPNYRINQHQLNLLELYG